MSAHQLPTSHVADTDLGSVEYSISGEGPVVLVVHGSPGGFDQGSLLGEFLVEAGFRVVAPSRPGYLRTPLTERNASPTNQAELLLALMTELEIAEFTVLCWSGGGPTSYALVARAPQRVQKFVSVAAVSHAFEWKHAAAEKLIFGTAFGNFLLRFMSKRTPNSLIKQTLDAEGNLSKSELARLTKLATSKPQLREFVLGLANCMTYRDPRKAGLETDQSNFADITDLGLADISTPTLLLHGTADADVGPEFSDYAAERIASSTLVSIPQGTHIALWVHPNSSEYQRQVVDFLRGD